MNKRRVRKIDNSANINLTPFVDVLFVLLIVFIMVTPIMLGGIKVELPSGKAEIIGVKKEPISVVIDTKGAIYIDDEKIRLNFLPQKLIGMTGGNKEAVIFVKADRRLNYGRIIKVVSKINLAGFTQVSLVTDLRGESHN